LALAEVYFTNKEGKIYTYSNKASLNYTIANINYNFEPININIMNIRNFYSKKTVEN